MVGGGSTGGAGSGVTTAGAVSGVGGTTGGSLGGVPVGAGVGAAGAGAAGFSGAAGASFSLRRRRKNDIAFRESPTRAFSPTSERSAPFSAAGASRVMPPTVTQRLDALGIELPPPPPPAGAYSPVVVHAGFAWVSGQIVFENGKVVSPGWVDRDVSVDAAKRLARGATLQALSALRAALGSLDRIERFVRVAVYVATSPGFDRPHEVANGSTELLIELFGENGRPARTTVGMASLPLGAAVEVEFQAAIR